mmetsp:Transcript_6312/g.22471  ORF Transcript_6312/g.22471 Transcript_6312/m.22471 type:complete len:275 (-) Transcript_6312:2668-3492(-)
MRGSIRQLLLHGRHRRRLRHQRPQNRQHLPPRRAWHYRARGWRRGAVTNRTPRRFVLQPRHLAFVLAPHCRQRFVQLRRRCGWVGVDGESVVITRRRQTRGTAVVAVACGTASQTTATGAKRRLGYREHMLHLLGCLRRHGPRHKRSLLPASEAPLDEALELQQAGVPLPRRNRARQRTAVVLELQARAVGLDTRQCCRFVRARLAFPSIRDRVVGPRRDGGGVPPRHRSTASRSFAQPSAERNRSAAIGTKNGCGGYTSKRWRCGQARRLVGR